MYKVLFLITFFLVGFIVWSLFPSSLLLEQPLTLSHVSPSPFIPVNSASPIALPTIPRSKTLQNSYHIFQTFNNCGPAAFSMALSYFGISESQAVLGQALRPYQNAQGDNDDKSVTLSELASKADAYGLLSYHRPVGTITLLKQFIAYNMPVLTRTWLSDHESIGHYRVVKGYDDDTQEIIQDDSLQGKNLRYSYEGFTSIWKKFNYEYVVLVPFDKKDIAERILGENLDETTAWKKAVAFSTSQLLDDPDDIYARFNLSVALYKTSQYSESVLEFEKIEAQLPFRTLWYQIEPIEAYFALGNYDRVLSITRDVLQNHNRAFSELYLLRGRVYKAQGNMQNAKAEFEKAVLYNKNLEIAQQELKNL